jgi:hypothetical protein
MANKRPKVENDESIKSKNILKTFCDQTTLPGWSYLSKDISRTGRFIWSSFMLIIFSVSIFFIYINIEQVGNKKVN